MKLSEKIGQTVERKFSVKENKKSSTVKTLIGKFNFKEMTLGDVLSLAVSGMVIRLQQKIRKNWDGYKDGEMVDIVVSKGRVKLSTKDRMLKDFNSLSKEQQMEFIKHLNG